jgi:hypothetical protein
MFLGRVLNREYYAVTKDFYLELTKELTCVTKGVFWPNV